MFQVKESLFECRGAEGKCQLDVKSVKFKSYLKHRPDFLLG